MWSWGIEGVNTPKLYPSDEREDSWYYSIEQYHTAGMGNDLQKMFLLDQAAVIESVKLDDP